MLLQQGSYTASFSTTETLIVNDANRLQLRLDLTPSSKDVHMGRSMFVCMDYYIKAMLTPVQNSDHRISHPQYMQSEGKLSKSTLCRLKSPPGRHQGPAHVR